MSAVKNFKQFDSVTYASGDHHFFNSNQRGKQVTKGVTKKIMQEWKILEENLPESSIFVRVYEDRIDLLRAAIVGPPDTPYYNGLFFFDICFPFNYPAQPPSAYYHSFGFRINPNLYETGAVCLSLLNTWLGASNERWNPSQSTMLQVLVSIQALVLNETPFNNEPLNIFKFQRFVLAYNEEVWVNNCKTMCHLIHRPPNHFKELVTEHFRENAEIILQGCRVYVSSRAKVGARIRDGISFSYSKNYRVSKRFKSSMLVLWPLLLDWFAKSGASSVEKFREEPMLLPKTKTIVKRRFSNRLLKCFGCLGKPDIRIENAIVVETTKSKQ